MNCYMVGVAGPSGAGKTSVCRTVSSLIGSSLVHLEDYSLERHRLKKVDIWPDRDSPESLDLDSVYVSLAGIRNRNEVMVPTYNSPEGKRGRWKTVKPSLVTVVEGALLFDDPDIRGLFDLRVYLDADQDVLLSRCKSSQSDFDLGYYEQVVLPACKKYVEPTRACANIVIKSDRPIEQLAVGLANLVWKYYHASRGLEVHLASCSLANA